MTQIADQYRSLAADLDFGATAESALDVDHARRLAATLDRDVSLEKGTPLPLPWHWAFFTPSVPTAQLGPDGHARLAAGSPAEGLPHRMWAGGTIVAHHPLRLGLRACRRSRIVAAEPKTGRSGRLLLVSIEHTVTQARMRCLVERQQLVFREPGAPFRAPADGALPTAPPDGWSDIVQLDAVQLFRFSALTFNSHRIHLDRDYATTHEGYPDLVVHGPLTAVLLADSCTRRGYALSQIEFRATAPLFAGTTFALVGEVSHEQITLQAVRSDDAVAMTATARISSAVQH